MSELAREAWVTLCPAHDDEFQVTHDRWKQEHARGLDSAPTGRVVKGFGKGTVVVAKGKPL